MEQISRDADRRTVGRSADVVQDRIQQRTLEQISDTPVPQVVVVFVEVFTVFSQDRVQQRFAELIFQTLHGDILKYNKLATAEDAAERRAGNSFTLTCSGNHCLQARCPSLAGTCLQCSSRVLELFARHVVTMSIHELFGFVHVSVHP